MGIGYSAFVRQQAEMGSSTASAEGLTDRQTDSSRAAMQRAIDRVTVAGVNAVSAIEAEYRELSSRDVGQLCRREVHDCTAESGIGGVDGSAKGESPSRRSGAPHHSLTRRGRQARSSAYDE